MAFTDDKLRDVGRVLDMALRCARASGGDAGRGRALMLAALNSRPELKLVLLSAPSPSPSPSRDAAATAPLEVASSPQLDAVYRRQFGDGRPIEFTGRELMQAIHELIGPITMAEPGLGRDQAFDRLDPSADDLLRQIEKRRPT